jgi:hypothetical protein
MANVHNMVLALLPVLHASRSAKQQHKSGAPGAGDSIDGLVGVVDNARVFVSDLDDTAADVHEPEKTAWMSSCSVGR